MRASWWVGNFALLLHGSSYVTLDLEVAYKRSRENTRRIADALRPFSPRPRGFPPELPFIFDSQSLLSTRVLTLGTSIGDVDLLGEIDGVGTFTGVDAAAQDFEVDGLQIRVLSVDALIAAKRAAGRRKDEAGLIELEAIKEARLLAQESGTAPRESPPTEDQNAPPQ